MAKLAVIDAGALIALCDPADPHHEWAVSVFAETGNYELVMSPLTMAEVMVYPARERSLDRFLKGIKGLGVSIPPIQSSDAEQLAEFRVNSKLKMPDVVVLQLAKSLDAAVITTDRQVGRVAASLDLDVFYC